MYIVALTLAILAGILFWHWQARRAEEIAGELEGAPRTPANLPRRLAYKRKSGKRGFALVDDPREAAVVLMVEIARAGREMSRAAREVIDDLIGSEFRLQSEDADALVAYAIWLLRDAAVADAVVARMTTILLDMPQIGPKEIVDLDGMLVAVSEADGRPNQDQLALLQTFRNVAGVRT